MATSKAKRSVHKKQSRKPNKRRTRTKSSSTKAAPRKNRGASADNPDRGGSSAERRTSNRRSAAHIMPGEFALREKTLPGRHFVEFPLVKGKVVERVQLFTTTNHNSLTIELQDQTSLVLGIEPGFTIQAQLMRLEKGELETLAEWPPIKNISDR